MDGKKELKQYDGQHQFSILIEQSTTLSAIDEMFESVVDYIKSNQFERVIINSQKKFITDISAYLCDLNVEKLLVSGEALVPLRL